MLERRSGRIVNIVSVVLAGAEGQADYAAANAAVAYSARLYKTHLRIRIMVLKYSFLASASEFPPNLRAFRQYRKRPANG
jgi:NAD(P)-dependent dehydrogenase (short-subunit alcohol dehydrogenase family)